MSESENKTENKIKFICKDGELTYSSSLFKDCAFITELIQKYDKEILIDRFQDVEVYKVSHAITLLFLKNLPKESYFLFPRVVLKVFMYLICSEEKIQEFICSIFPDIINSNGTLEYYVNVLELLDTINDNKIPLRVVTRDYTYTYENLTDKCLSEMGKVISNMFSGTIYFDSQMKKIDKNKIGNYLKKFRDF
jgi:hypothetical protein